MRDGEFQSTLSVRRATFVYGGFHCWVTISIHALRKESDVTRVVDADAAIVFQSTLSVRRATEADWGRLADLYISIHALRKESDSARIMALWCAMDFNPRSP